MICNVSNNLMAPQMSLITRLMLVTLTLLSFEASSQRIKIHRTNESEVLETTSLLHYGNPLNNSLFYYIDIYVGTPPQHLRAKFDTGSTELWLQCSKCLDCVKSAPKFDFTLSSSYVSFMYESNQCKRLHLAKTTRGENGICELEMSYGGGHTKVTAIYSMERFIIDGQKFYLNFGCAKLVSGHLQNDTSGVAGIFGLNIGPTSPINQMFKMNQTFSYCLVGEDPANLDDGYLEFNSPIPNDAVITELYLNPQIPYETYIKFEGVYIDDELIPLNSNAFKVQKNGAGGVLLDTGAILSYFPMHVYRVIRDHFDAAMIKKKFQRTRKSYLDITTSGRFYDLCYGLSELGAEDEDIPVIDFDVGGGFFSLTGSSLFTLRGKNVYCLTIGGHADSVTIMGNLAQQHHRIFYDFANLRLGLLSNQC